MPIRLHISTQPLSWEPRKYTGALQMIKMLLAREGAPNCEIRVEKIGAADDPPPGIMLTCSGCDVQWQSMTFSACPKCGARSTVSKCGAPLEEFTHGPSAIHIDPEFEKARGAEVASGAHNAAPPGAVPGPATTFWTCGKCTATFDSPVRAHCPKCKEWKHVSRVRPDLPKRPRGRPRKYAVLA